MTINGSASNGNGNTDPDLELAQVLPPGPDLNDEEKKDPVKVNWAIFERLGIVDNNVRASVKVAALAIAKTSKLEGQVAEVCIRVGKIEEAHKIEEHVDAAVQEVKADAIIIKKSLLVSLGNLAKHPAAIVAYIAGGLGTTAWNWKTLTNIIKAAGKAIFDHFVNGGS